MEKTLAVPSAEQLKSAALLERILTKPSVLTDIVPASVKEAESFLHYNDFPTSKDENWKYTRTTKLSQGNWTRALESVSDFKESIVSDQESFTYRFSNGLLLTDQGQKETSSAFICTSLKKATQLTLDAIAMVEQHTHVKPNFFSAVNYASCTDGLTIVVKKNCKVELPIQLLFMQSGADSIINTRVDILMEEGAEASVLVGTFSADMQPQWSNLILNAYLKENSSLTLYKVQQNSNEHYAFAQENIAQAKDSRFDIVTMTIDGGWVRNNLNILLQGENAESHLSGFYLPRDKQMVDNHTMVDHRVPHCNSNELYKGVLYDQSTGVFNGKVYVQKDAQKTNAYQNNANILASDYAQMNTKPELEIYADDVKCSHGTTTGQMDEQALFYLQARGIGQENARKLLTTAFIGEVLNKVEHPGVKNYVVNQLTKKNLLAEELN